MTSRQNINMVDYGDETSSVGIRFLQIDAGNFAVVMAAMDDVLSAVEGVSLMNTVKDTRIAVVTETGAGLPADPNAQRESKWLVRAIDQVNGRAVNIEIPGADLSLLQANSQLMDLTSVAGLALKTALEANALSVDGNAIVVSTVIHVGRNV